MNSYILQIYVVCKLLIHVLTTDRGLDEWLFPIVLCGPGDVINGETYMDQHWLG